MLGCTPNLPAIAAMLIGTRDAHNARSTARRRPTGSCSDLMMTLTPIRLVGYA